MEAGDWINLAGLVIATGLAVKGLIEYRVSIAEKQRAMRWQQAETARQIIETLRGNLHVAAALKMLDWTEIAYGKPDGTMTLPFSTDERRSMLRVDNVTFDPEAERDAEFIRDCFDRFFEDCCLIQAYIDNGLVREEDLSAYFSHYMRLASAPDEAAVLDPFARTYGYSAFFSFRERMAKGGSHG